MLTICKLSMPGMVVDASYFITAERNISLSSPYLLSLLYWCPMEWTEAGDVKKDLLTIIRKLHLDYIAGSRIIAFRSYGSSSRARARIWAFPKIWQQALGLPAHYVIEVLSEKYDKLASDDKMKVLIHELLHIPKNFSGSLRPHKAHKWRLNHHLVEKYFKQYKQS